MTPAWVRDAVFYQIFPDRFARSAAVPKPANLEPWGSPPTFHGFKGGDLIGVAERLDYVRELGISAIYFCPIFQSAANHRYHTHDYLTVDPILGGNEALDLLIAEAHRRDIRIVLDGVFNHASRGFFQFNHILENGDKSPYIDWFSVYAWPLNPYGPGDPGYQCWWGLPALPKFNTGTQAVREFLWSVGEHWIERGIDGWRLDVPNEIDDDEFWREFRRRVKRANPDAYIVGEIWGDARRWLQGDQFDAVMNYLFTRACLGFFAGTGLGLDYSLIEGTGLAPVEQLDAPGFRHVVDSLLDLYPWPITLSQLNLLDSHDTPRFLSIAREDASAFRLATLFQMTFPGAPCVYYGDEVGLLGGRDPDCRRGFPWDRSGWDDGLRDYVRDCIALRHGHRVLRQGGFGSLIAEDNLCVYARELDGDLAVIALNAGQSARTLDVELPAIPRSGLEPVFGDFTGRLDGRTIRDWRLPPREGRVLLAAGQPEPQHP
ncbi:MAG: alpha-amylase [Chloroflexi bacterium]|nr:alpha-amylase [Chloroflexota bacterium]